MSDSDADEGQSSDDEELDDGNADAKSAISIHDDEQVTQLIDDNGNLFGVVNIIDALVVLLTLAVVVAGVALVFGGGSSGAPETETTYATLDLGTHPPNIISEINEGDSHSGLTITDVYVVPQGGGDQSRVLARAEIEGSASDGSISYEDAPLRIGRSLSIATNRYKTSGAIRSVGNTTTLNIAQRDLVVETTIDAEDAEQLTAGDELRIDRRTIGTVKSVTRYGTSDGGRMRVVVGLSVSVFNDGYTPRYGLTPVERGSEIRLPIDNLRLNGRIIAVGTTEAPGTPATRTVTLQISEVRDTFAGTYQPGMTEVVGGETVAEITAVDVEPSILVTTGEDGKVRSYDHPINRDVTMTAELSVREVPSGIRFKGDPLRQGSRIELSLGSTTIRPTVVQIR